MTRARPCLPTSAPGCSRWPAWALALLLGAGVVAPALAQGGPDTPVSPQALAAPDLPARVGRLADTQGPVWWFDREEGRWLPAQPDRPVVAGDRVATGPDGRATLRFGTSSLRLAEATDAELLRLDDRQLRVQLHRGSLAVRVRTREQAAQTVVGTPQAWVQPARAGLARLDRPDADGDTTYLSSWRGEWQVLNTAGLQVEAGQRLMLRRERRPDGALLPLQTRPAAMLDDAFAAWVQAEDRLDDRTAYAAWVPADVTGQEELDRHGRWEQHPEHGPVWLPLDVARDWAPYRYGRWDYQPPWGWVWVDDARWGFAPYHYGRWVSWHGRWSWVPGPRHTHPVVPPPGSVSPPPDRRRPAPPPRRHALDSADVPPVDRGAGPRLPPPPLPLARPLPTQQQPTQPAVRPAMPTAEHASPPPVRRPPPAVAPALPLAAQPLPSRPAVREPVPAAPTAPAATIPTTRSVPTAPLSTDGRAPRVRTPEQPAPERRAPEPKPTARDRDRGVQQQ